MGLLRMRRADGGRVPFARNFARIWFGVGVIHGISRLMRINAILLAGPSIPSVGSSAAQRTMIVFWCLCLIA